MKQLSTVVGIFLGAILLFFVLSFLGYEGYKFFSPRYAAVARNVFENTQAYNEGMVRDLENLRMQYISADHEQKDALRAIILHRFEVYPEDRLPPNLRNFYNSLRSS